MWMNEWEIDEMVDFTAARMQQYAPYAKYLGEYRDAVNQVSDGWVHWRAGSKPADKLSGLLQQAKTAFIERSEFPDEALFRKALSPMKAAATKHGFAAPTLVVLDAADGSSLRM
jgi:hypothetical protein